VKPYRFLEDARAELVAAAEWYAERYPPAASAFVDAIEDAVTIIRRLPKAWPLAPGSTTVRAKVVPRLDYTVFFAEHDDEIIIVAIAHQRRRPAYWVKRLRPP